MARNGAGTYSLPTGQPVVTGTTISSTVFNTLTADLANALTTSIASDGQTTPTANLPMGGFKLTGLSAGAAAGQSLRWEQLFSQGAPVVVASAATVELGGQTSVAVEITGITTITSFGTNYNGPRFLRFTGALTLTHNATTLNLPGAANITTAAGDTCIAYPNSGGNGWNVVQYQRVSAAPTASPTVQVFTASGTYTKPAGARRIRVRVVGGGGGGGGVGTGNNAAGGGGGGGYSEKFIDAAAITTVTVTVGSAGAAGSSAGGQGGTGGTSSFGAYCSATGGVGGDGGASATGVSNGGIGGSGSSGDINSYGQPGTANFGTTASGGGGSSALGGGGRGVNNSLSPASGNAYGGGGAGAGNNSGASAGATGAAGIVIVEEFY